MNLGVDLIVIPTPTSLSLPLAVYSDCGSSSGGALGTGLWSTSFAWLFNWHSVQANERPGSPRRVGRRANQDRWRGVAASQGGEPRNGGRGPVKHGWGRSALSGVQQCGSRLGGPRRHTRGGEGRPAGPSVAEGDCARQGEQQVPTGGPAGRCWAGPGRPSRAALGPAGVGASPVTGPPRPVSGVRGAASYSPLSSPPQSGGILEIPSGTGGGAPRP